MDLNAFPAIDAHGHYGVYRRVDGDSLVDGFMSADAIEVRNRARACGVEWTLVSPLEGLLPRGQANSVAANENAYEQLQKVPGLLQYVIVNPLQSDTFSQARRMLQSPWCAGIKIHPEEHGYKIAEHGEKLFAFFEEIQAPVMAHSGCPNSLPVEFVPFANRHPGARLLLAHLGNGAGDHQRVDLQVRAVQAARHGNLWIDTSSARSILPGLIEWAVREVGADRLLFGSDTPLYHVAMQRARIETAEIPDSAKALILRENAWKFFNLSRSASLNPVPT
jgi:predicted TIM-barrel fold metal-dependent hydrolase